MSAHRHDPGPAHLCGASSGAPAAAGWQALAQWQLHPLELASWTNQHQNCRLESQETAGLLMFTPGCGRPN